MVLLRANPMAFQELLIVSRVIHVDYRNAACSLPVHAATIISDSEPPGLSTTILTGIDIMKKNTKSPLAAALGSAVISSLAMTAVHAEANPFGVQELSSGYMQVAEMACGDGMKMEKPKTPEGACAGKKTEKAAETKAKEAACGEGKCGAMMDGDKMKKGMEGTCGDMMKGKEGSCGDTVNKDKAAGQ